MCMNQIKWVISPSIDSIRIRHFDYAFLVDKTHILKTQFN